MREAAMEVRGGRGGDSGLPHRRTWPTFLREQRGAGVHPPAVQQISYSGHVNLPTASLHAVW